jgi:anaerobic nitric oxide reductase flavorubredoxin
VVKTGDKLSLGSKELIFVEAQMLHWPDSMISYLPQDNILFSNDAFDQHISSEGMYNDLVDQAELFQEAIAQGITQADQTVAVKLFNIARSDKNDVITEIFKSKAILVGSPIVNKGILSAVAAILEEVKGLRFQSKKAAAFGCYGWSGEAVKVISEKLREGGFQLLNDGLREKWNPDTGAVDHCIQFGKAFALSLK